MNTSRQREQREQPWKHETAGVGRGACTDPMEPAGHGAPGDLVGRVGVGGDREAGICCSFLATARSVDTF